MQIMQNPWVWVAGIAALTFVVWFALRQSKGSLDVNGPGGVKVKVDKNGVESRRVSVGDHIRVEGRVGNITGIEGTSETTANRPVDVAAGAEIRGTAGDITGVRETGNR